MERRTGRSRRLLTRSYKTKCSFVAHQNEHIATMGVHVCYQLVAVFLCCIHIVPVTSQCSDDNSDLGVLRTVVAQIRNTVDRQERRNADILQAMEQLQHQFNDTVEQLRRDKKRSTEQLQHLNDSMAKQQTQLTNIGFMISKYYLIILHNHNILT